MSASTSLCCYYDPPVLVFSINPAGLPIIVNLDKVLAWGDTVVLLSDGTYTINDRRAIRDPRVRYVIRPFPFDGLQYAIYGEDDQGGVRTYPAWISFDTERLRYFRDGRLVLASDGGARELDYFWRS